MIIFHTINDLIALVTGLAVILLSKGTRIRLIPALYRRRFDNWYQRHYSFMLWSYIGLIMAFNSHFFRPVFLFLGNEVGLGNATGLILSILILWVLPPVLGKILINRRSLLYKQKFGTNE